MNNIYHTIKKNYSRILISVVVFLSIGCENPLVEEHKFLDIYLEATQDNNGYYHIEYTGSTYHPVYYQTTPNERVFWGSPDTFVVEWMWHEFETPIINYSTYANGDGNGQQFFYLHSQSVGDTLMIYGHVNENASDYLYFILE